MNIDKFTITSYDQILGFDRTNGNHTKRKKLISPVRVVERLAL